MIFVVASAGIALFAAFLGFIVTGLMNGGIVAGRPLGQLHVSIYGFDPAVYVNVESLLNEGRLSLCWPVDHLHEPDIEDVPDAGPLPPFRTEVGFRDIGFGYLPDRPVLREAEMVARRGSVMAIVGATGSGKSTLMALPLRMADPDTGRIEIDGNDLRTITVDSLRRARHQDPQATDEQVAAVARTASALDFIEALPEGFETRLGRAEARLSVGQKQRWRSHAGW